MDDKAVSDMQISKLNYKGWPNSVRLTNGRIDLVVTTDVGPRVIRFGFVNGDNEFKEFVEQLGKTGGEDWRIYGGHRLWHAPENMPRTYFPDNTPVGLEERQGFVRISQPEEPTTRIQKEMDISLAPEACAVHVTHRLRNCNPWSVELAPWALTVMAPGGTVILPLPRRQRYEENILPTNTLAFWAYTDMTDPRWTWGKQYLLLRQDPSRSSPQKVGLMVPDGWIAYARNGHLFVKRTAYIAGATYPDYGSSVETFTNGDMLEVETLGPLKVIQPGEMVEHREDWYLFDDVPVPSNDAAVIARVLPVLANT